MFPITDPHKTGYLDVDDGHHLYYECCGNPSGIPVVFLHGGPGGGIVPEMRQFFDPKKYHAVIFCQRGAGKSRADDILRANCIDTLVDDLEKLRMHLGIPAWAVLGGSWGTTLGLFYAIRYPRTVRALILIGVFLATRAEVDWQSEPWGAPQFMPDWYGPVRDMFSDRPDGQTIWQAFDDILHEPQSPRAIAAARTYMRWNRAISRHDVPLHILSKLDDDIDNTMKCMRIVTHFYKHYYTPQNRLDILRGTAGLGHIPCHIVQGRYDLICTPRAAYDLHCAYPGSTLHIVQNGGHSALDQGIAAKAVEILNDLT